MSGQQQYREGYWDYMARRLKEEAPVDIEQGISTRKNLNKDLTLIDEHMVILAEECGELTQACMKIVRRQYLDSKCRRELTEEIGDVLCLINKVIELNLVTRADVFERVEVKKEKLKKRSKLDDR